MQKEKLFYYFLKCVFLLSFFKPLLTLLDNLAKEMPSSGLALENTAHRVKASVWSFAQDSSPLWMSVRIT